MATASNTAPATAPVAKRSWNLPCPHCGEQGVRIDPNDLGDDGTFNCVECENEWTFAHVRDLLAAWPKFLAWLDLAPAVEGED